MSTYIYLNHYRSKSSGQEYLYIGSHTWPGDGLDPAYHGSSKVAARFHWKPYRIDILEVVSPERKTVAEREWIHKYLTDYGVADCALEFNHEWLGDYNKHGLMLNLHANGAEHLNTKESHSKSLQTRIDRGMENYVKHIHTKEVYSKIYQTNLANGNFKKFCEAAQTPEAKAKRVRTKRELNQFDVTPEILAKRIKSRAENGAVERWSNAAHTEEAVAKQVNTRKQNNSDEKAQETKRLRGTDHPTYWIVSVPGLCDNVRLKQACTLAGNPNWINTISRKFRAGQSEVIHHGFTFQLVSSNHAAP